MSPGVRKLALTVHVAASVGWLGAVTAFLALAIVGLTSRDAQLVQAVYLVMRPIGWFVIVPFSLLSLLSGVVSSLGTPWGLLRYYWVSVKLLMTIPATIVLLIHMQPITYMAGVAASKTLSTGDLHGLRVQILAEAAAALVVLLVATVLSVYKPRGMTQNGQRWLSRLSARSARALGEATGSADG